MVVDLPHVMSVVDEHPTSYRCPWHVLYRPTLLPLNQAKAASSPAGHYLFTVEHSRISSLPKHARLQHLLGT